MKIDTEKLKKDTRNNFEAAWRDGIRYVSERRISRNFPKASPAFRAGKPHPVFETIQKLRETYLRLGFEEVINPVVINEKEVYKQFWKEAHAVLDRCYYLAGLPRPDIGLSEEKVRKMSEYFKKELQREEVEAIKRTLHRYKKGEIGGDDLIYEMAQSAGVEDLTVTKIIKEVFPELKALSPISSESTLRSHMTSGWFLTLKEIWYKKPFPIKLFSVDRCFRREQKEDETRIQAYHSASCVFCDEEVSIDEGKDIARGLLSQFGFEKIRFRKDEKRSKYYIPETQTEVFIYHPTTGWVEIATFGIYSPTALAQYDIPYLVLNLGLGVERLAMIIYEEADVRALTFPQFYGEWKLSDMEIAKMISVEKTPSMVEGEEIAKNIVRICEEKGKEKSPCEFLAYQGNLFGRDIEVWVVEREENTLLCGPAYLNEIVVHNGSIFALPREKKWESVFNEGISTNIRFLDAFAALAAHKIEKEVQMQRGKGDTEKVSEIRARIVRSGADINIKISETALRYITARKKKIDVRGPVFINVVLREK